jgi:hypothetical protein
MKRRARALFRQLEGETLAGKLARSAGKAADRAERRKIEDAAHIADKVKALLHRGRADMQAP